MTVALVVLAGTVVGLALALAAVLAVTARDRRLLVRAVIARHAGDLRALETEQAPRAKQAKPTRDDIPEDPADRHLYGL